MLFGCARPAVDLVEKEQFLTLRNAKIDMYKGSMRLVVNQWGKIEKAEARDINPKVS
jgi:replication factor A1